MSWSYVLLQLPCRTATVTQEHLYAPDMVFMTHGWLLVHWETLREARGAL